MLQDVRQVEMGSLEQKTHSLEVAFGWVIFFKVMMFSLSSQCVLSDNILVDIANCLQHCNKTEHGVGYTI